MISDSSSTPLGRTIRHLRTQAGLSMSLLGKYTGLEVTAIRRMETGVVKAPSLAMLNRLARGLSVDPEILYDAAWETTGQPLPTLPTYLREKYHLRDEQIQRLSESLNDLTKE